MAGAAQPSTNVNIDNNLLTRIPLLNVIYDNGTYFSTNGQVSINQDGVYLLTGQVNFSQNSNGSRWVHIYKNGSELIASGSSSPNAGTSSSTATTMFVAKLKAGDYIELCGSHLAGATLSITAATTQFSIARLGD